MTTTMPDIAAEWHDPETLLTGKNVRLDPRLDAEFLASVKDLGVKQPIVALRTPDGGLRVRLGHRRRLAAIDAGIQVPVFVAGDEGDSKAEEVARVLTQWAENHHRAALTAADEAAVVQTLFDLKLSDTQIHKRTGLTRDRITAARAVTGSELATEAAARWEFLDLEQAAVLAEMETDTEAVTALVAAAKDSPGQFAHVAQTLRDTAAERAQKAAVIAGLEDAGVPIVDTIPWQQALQYLRDGDGNQFTEETHQSCPGHIAMLQRDYRRSTEAEQAARAEAKALQARANAAAAAAGEDTDDDDDPEEAPYQTFAEAEAAGWVNVWYPVYGCADPAANGHKTQSAGSSGGGKADATDAEKDAAKAERRKVIDGNKAWRTAETVRRAWLAEFLTRKTPPKGALKFILAAVAGGNADLRHSMEQGHQLAATLLGLQGPDGDPYGQKTRENVTTAIRDAAEGRAQVIALAVVLAAHEEHTGVHTWRHAADKSYGQYWRYSTGDPAVYLTALEDWGYVLSDIEATVTKPAKAAAKRAARKAGKTTADSGRTEITDPEGTGEDGE